MVVSPHCSAQEDHRRLDASSSAVSLSRGSSRVRTRVRRGENESGENESGEIESRAGSSQTSSSVGLPRLQRAVLWRTMHFSGCKVNRVGLREAAGCV